MQRQALFFFFVRSISVPQISAFTSDCDFCIIIYCLWSRLKDCFCMCLGSQNVELVWCSFFRTHSRESIKSSFHVLPLSLDQCFCLFFFVARWGGKSMRWKRISHKSRCVWISISKKIKSFGWCLEQTFWKLWRCKAISLLENLRCFSCPPEITATRVFLQKDKSATKYKKDESHFSSLLASHKVVKNMFYDLNLDSKKRFPSRFHAALSFKWAITLLTVSDFSSSIA